MTASSPPDRMRRAVLAVLVGSLLFTFYLLTFSGVPRTDDERFIMDTAESMAVRGNLLLNQTAYLRPIQTTDVEPAQPALSVPLYWLAYHIPWVGNAQALFLFSPLVTALTGALLFLHTLDLGYEERTAVVAALLFGLATLAWPYTKTYFREPLTMLNLFAAAFLLTRWRRAFAAEERRHWPYLGASVLVTLLALLSKEAALIALPALALIAYPGGLALKARRRQIVAILIGLVGVALLFVLGVTVFRTQLEAAVSRYVLLNRALRLLEGLPQAGAGIVGYLFSPGRGLWWYSPPLLLALGAPFVAPRARWRETWLPLGLLALFVVIYAAVRGTQWQGGTGWGPRYMLPLLPFLMTATLPLTERMLRAAGPWPKALLGLIALVGLAVQLGGVYVDLFDYEAHLTQQTGLLPYDASLAWNVRWSQALGGLLYLPQARTDIAWLIPAPDGLVLGALTIAGLALAAGLLWLMRHTDLSRRSATALLAGVPLALAALTTFALWRAYDDPRYRGDDAALAALRAFLNEHVQPEEVILLNSPTYVPHFMNYYKGVAAWYSLPFAPGERYSPEQVPQVISDDLDVLIGKQAAGTLAIFSEGGTFYNGHALWLVADQGPWLTWAVRPVEWYMSRRLYPVSATDFSPTVRLIEYLPLRAPSARKDPRHVLDVRLGAGMRLVGFDLEAPSRPLAAGDMLGLSLVWEALAPLDEDYIVAAFLIAPDGRPVLQQDRMPQGGFAPTSRWQPGQRLRDNYGFILPADLPAGDYQLWVLAYRWPSLERLPVSGPDGQPLGDHVVLTTLSIR